jgi:hypothetical protein
LSLWDRGGFFCGQSEIVPGRLQQYVIYGVLKLLQSASFWKKQMEFSSAWSINLLKQGNYDKKKKEKPHA